MHRPSIALVHVPSWHPTWKQLFIALIAFGVIATLYTTDFMSTISFKNSTPALEEVTELPPLQSPSIVEIEPEKTSPLPPIMVEYEEVSKEIIPKDRFDYVPGLNLKKEFKFFTDHAQGRGDGTVFIAQTFKLSQFK